MNIHLEKKIRDVSMLFDIGSSYITVDNLGIEKHDKKTFEVKDAIYDFFGSFGGFTSDDQKYFVLHDYNATIKVYSVNAFKEIATIPIVEKKDCSICGVSESLDGKNFFVILMEETKDEDDVPDFFIEEYSYEDGRHILTLENEINFKDIITMKPFNGYFLFDKDGNVYFSKDLVDFDKLNITTANILRPDFDEENGLLFISSSYGLKVIDSSLDEINRIDMISDAPMSQDSINMLMSKGFKGTSSLFEETDEKLMYFAPLKDHILYALTTTFSSRKSAIKLFDEFTGELLYKMDFGFPIMESYKVSDDTIAIQTNRMIALLKVDF